MFIYTYMQPPGNYQEYLTRNSGINDILTACPCNASYLITLHNIVKTKLNHTAVDLAHQELYQNVFPQHLEKYTKYIFSKKKRQCWVPRPSGAQCPLGMTYFCISHSVVYLTIFRSLSKCLYLFTFIYFA